jgi:hypothetical protein
MSEPEFNRDEYVASQAAAMGDIARNDPLGFEMGAMAMFGKPMSVEEVGMKNNLVPKI